METKLLVTGNQLKAARALAEVEQIELAKLSGVSVGTIRNMEARSGEVISSGHANVSAVQKALEARGIEFLNHGQPGVRLRCTHP
jgi:transcriptional regulator with XRE-family HTH domain